MKAMLNDLKTEVVSMIALEPKCRYGHGMLYMLCPGPGTPLTLYMTPEHPGLPYTIHIYIYAVRSPEP